MRSITIKEAIAQSIISAGRPLSANEVYEHIVANNLYQFGAKDPAAIVKNLLRKNTAGLNLKSGSAKKIFRITADNKYTVI